MLPFTQKTLQDWAGPQVFRAGQALLEKGAVLAVDYEHPNVRGSLARGETALSCQFRLLSGGEVEGRCPCRDSAQRGIICAHVIALGLELIRRDTDPERQRKAAEEKRRADRIANFDESAYVQRVPPGTRGSVPARLHLSLGSGWQEECRSGKVTLHCAVDCDGDLYPLDSVPRAKPLAMSKEDESVLFVLEDISEGPAAGRLAMALSDFVNVLDLMPGKALFRADDAEPITVNAMKMRSVFRLDLDRENGELILMVHTELPFIDKREFPFYIISGREGWVYHADHLWPLENLLPPPMHSVYEEPVTVERPNIPKFLENERPLLEAHMVVETDLSADLFTIEPEEPKFRLVVRGSPASVAATLYARYGEVELVAGKPDPAGHFSHPAANDFLAFTVRNDEREAEALETLARLGFDGDRGDELESIVGSREVLNFLGSSLPKLRRTGWQVELKGRVEPFVDEVDFITPVVRVTDDSSGGWFDVGFDYEDGDGAGVPESEIQRALLRGDSYVERKGRTYLLDADAINASRDVFNDCSSREGGAAGTFRMDAIHAAYVKSSLDALDGIDVEAARSWQTMARRQNGELTIEPAPLGDRLDGILRSYQKDGVAWLRFLERNALGGILADEMGLGKTLQTLAWLHLERDAESARRKPALIVCPTSLVDNWAEECRRFTPETEVLILSGSSRHESWDAVPGAGLVITSYALMRRDIDKHVEFDYAAIVLDEAQHIKNRSTQNAVAAKRLAAAHRLVLTGTPVENSVMDLWSIMDFLMPGYLGGHEAFRENYERPIATGGPAGEDARVKLRRKLQPFLLRRLKKEVATDLPDKIQRVASCPLSRDQATVYKELVESSRRKLSAMVSKQGFQKSRMEILKTLLRLRQTCCHLELLKLQDVNFKQPSGKMALFFELLDEALDGGHRALVFSQFTSMLAILRREMDERELTYCYLDGSTKDRQQVVREFNTNRSIPVFLMSLKAGGTGLNLTGADMVIHFDPWWNPAVEDQATDRAHRIGQKRTVYSIKLITRDTVEEKVLAMQQRKQEVINATLTSDDQVMQKLTWDDIQGLLTL